MEWKDLILDGYGRIMETMEEVLTGVEKEDLTKQPHPDCNSMGWLAWHLTRVQDDHIADLMGEEQLWIKDGWHAKFNRPADRKDIGFGNTPEDVAAFQSPDVKTLKDYHRAVYERSKKFISSLDETGLSRELNEPWFQPLPTVGVRMVSVLADCLQHVGQIAYVRGYLNGKGWLPY